METFWKRWVRTPSLVVFAVSIALGAWGAVDWAPALCAAALAGFAAKAADSAAARRSSEAESAPAPLVEFPRRAPSRDSRYDRAA
jgi:hypothetical protein